MSIRPFINESESNISLRTYNDKAQDNHNELAISTDVVGSYSEYEVNIRRK
jgi:hypothetical protein